MRRRLYLIQVYGASTLSSHGMAKCPWRKGKRFPLHIAGIIENHPVTGGGHSGNKPMGKRKKGDRLQPSPPGTPSGKCTRNKETCRCGGHYNQK